MNEVKIAVTDSRVEKAKDIARKAKLYESSPLAILLSDLAELVQQDLEASSPSRIAKAVADSLGELGGDANQSTQAFRALREIRACVDKVPPDRLREAHAALKGVVDHAQNGPPDGEADGSISPDTWLFLRAMHDDAELIVNAVDRMNRRRL